MGNIRLKILFSTLPDEKFKILITINPVTKDGLYTRLTKGQVELGQIWDAKKRGDWHAIYEMKTGDNTDGSGYREFVRINFQ